ncbi:phage protein [Limosilactobacillus antri DSM 16041]|uniref:Phage protein n=2 Tax=Limosilactobacillus antri DSM 16041 TaxID=525309 RepID=A0ABR5P1P4_9LACO|nr:phage protein [Limosilactobacillus antri DSM 16041]
MMNNVQFDVKTVNNLLGIDDSFKAPKRMMEAMLNNDERPELFKKFLRVSANLDFDWFHEYFEDEQAERKSKKQDFTPNSIAQVLNNLVDSEQAPNTYYEVAAGTGGILIKRWLDDRTHDRIGNPLSNKTALRFLSVFTYDPRAYWYQVEELSDRAIPFLIFNMAIRGMNGVAIQCDSLTREAKDVYFIRNNTSDFMKFSEVIKCPHEDVIRKEFNISEWVDSFGN